MQHDRPSSGDSSTRGQSPRPPSAASRTGPVAGGSDRRDAYSGAGEGTELARELEVADGVPDGVLHVSVRAASCDEGGEFPACHVHQQDWGVPLRLLPGGPDRLALVLRGLDA